MKSNIENRIYYFPRNSSILRPLVLMLSVEVLIDILAHYTAISPSKEKIRSIYIFDQ